MNNTPTCFHSIFSRNRSVGSQAGSISARSLWVRRRGPLAGCHAELAALLCLFVCLSINASAATLTWNGSVNDNWSNSSNWTPNKVPGATDNAVIPSGGAPFIDTTREVTNLQIETGGTLDIVAPGLLEISGSNSSNSGQINLNPNSLGVGGVFDVASGAILTNFGTFNLNAGTASLEGAGTVANKPTGTIAGRGTISGVKIELGTIHAIGSIPFKLNSGAILLGTTLTGTDPFIANSVTVNGLTVPVIFAAGTTVEIPSGGILFVQGTLTDQGNVVINGTGSTNAKLVFNGISEINGGTTGPGGHIIMLGPKASVGGLPGASVTFNNEHLSGSGNIGSGQVKVNITVLSSITANGSIPLTIQPNSGGFTNNGTLSVSAGSTAVIEGPWTNLSGTTLTGGSYNVAGTLQYDNATSTIVTNAANTTLTGPAARIIDSGSHNMLRTLSFNKRMCKLLGGATLSDTATTLTNSGTFVVGKGSTLAVGNVTLPGAYNQTGGSTTVDGTLSALNGIHIDAGSVFGNGGTFNGNVISNGSWNIGDAVMKAGSETIKGTFTSGASSVLNVDIGGTTPGTLFDQLTITGAAALKGTLNLSRIGVFVPTFGETFDILNAPSVSGKFSIVNGTGINSSERFSVTYNSKNVTLAVLP
jgi:hypothetical protein